MLRVLFLFLALRSKSVFNVDEKWNLVNEAINWQKEGDYSRANTVLADY